jgi:hypothetical protein
LGIRVISHCMHIVHVPFFTPLETQLDRFGQLPVLTDDFWVVVVVLLYFTIYNEGFSSNKACSSKSDRDVSLPCRKAE